MLGVESQELIFIRGTEGPRGRGAEGGAEGRPREGPRGEPIGGPIGWPRGRGAIFDTI